MMARNKEVAPMAHKKYPGIEEAEHERIAHRDTSDEPDFIAGAPNYAKFEGWTADEVLAWLNID